MLKIEENFIYLTRGDTAYITIELEEDEFDQGDVVEFNIKKSLNDIQEYELHKRIEIESKSNNLVLKIEPEDTVAINYGLYFYDVQLTRSNGDIFTIITPDKDFAKPNFKLLKEVTMNE